MLNDDENLENTLTKSERERKSFRSKRFQINKSSLVKAEINKVPVNIKNISSTGIGFSSEINVLKDSDLECSVNLPGQNNPIFKGSIQNIWSKPVSNVVESGIKFKGGLIEESSIDSIQIYANFQGLLEQCSNETIPESFIVYIYKFKTFLEQTQTMFDKLERKISIENRHYRESIERNVYSLVFPLLNKRMMEFSMELAGFYDNFSAIRNELRKCYRDNLLEFFQNSSFLRRVFEKPLGYAGDFQMMMQIYENDCHHGSLFSRFMQYYGLSEPGSVSVQERRNNLFENMKLKYKESKNSFKVLSVACGPALELSDFLEWLAKNNKGTQVSIHLYDQDHSALSLAQILLQKSIEKYNLSRFVSVHCINESITSIIKNKSKLTGKSFEFIYSAGLYDYLSEKVANRLTENLFDYLEDDGRLLIGNFFIENPSRAVMDFICDWNLIHRSKKEMSDLISRGQKEVQTDNSGSQLYLVVKKA